MEEIQYEYKEREIGHAGDGESLSGSLKAARCEAAVFAGYLNCSQPLFGLFPRSTFSGVDGAVNKRKSGWEFRIAHWKYN